MIRQRKDWIPLGLMLVSLALLLASQGIWLQRTYRAEKTQFVKRSGELLDIAVRELFDSLTIKRVREEVGLEDSSGVQGIGKQVDLTINYSTNVSAPHRRIRKRIASLPDSLSSFRLDTGHMIVITQLNGSDSAATGPPGLDGIGIDRLLTMADRSPIGMQILFGMARDSLPADSVGRIYAGHLRQENLYLPFELLPVEDHQPESSVAGLQTRPVMVNLFNHQQLLAHFPRYRAFLLGRMWEEILFSVFLFGMISLAFAFIYRSLLKQHRLSLMKNDLLSNITHELKTPISSVSVAIEAMRDFGVLQNPELAREYLDISRDELKRLSLLVDRVLRLTTFEQKEPDLHFEDLDMAEITKTILRTMQVQFDQYEAHPELALSGQDFAMQGDRIHLSSVLFNLLDNALKYRNGEQTKVQLHVEEQGDHLQISVKDNGLGIPAAYQQRIFEKFFRVPQGNVHNTKGYGLGLSYVAAVVAKHGGRIQVKSQSGAGSQFILTFPKTQPA